MITLLILSLLQMAGVASFPFLAKLGLGSGKTQTASDKNKDSFFSKWFDLTTFGRLADIFRLLFTGKSHFVDNSDDFVVDPNPIYNDPDVWNPYGGTSRGEAPPGWLGSGNSGALGVPSQTSAQGNVVTVPDAGSVAGHIEDTENGGSAQGVPNTTDWLKQIMSTLGISSLFGDNESGHSWLSYDDIVNDERLYGQGAIADARRWQEYMAGTAYQRTVEDIKAAGLNPWLAVQSGSLSPASWGAVDTGSALGNISTSLGQSLTNSNSNSSSAIIVALIMMLAKVMMS